MQVAFQYNENTPERVDCRAFWRFRGEPR